MNNLIFGNSEEEIKKIDNNSVSIILTDPPYLYLKNQKLERKFDELEFFAQCKRVLKNDGFIVLFGRGVSFYRWNTILSELGFVFKEEFIWDKGHSTSPLMPISRIHETISIFTKKSGVLNKVKIPYLQMKCNDFESIITDIKRLKTILQNTNSLDVVLNYLQNNNIRTEAISNTITTFSKNRKSMLLKDDRCVSVVKCIRDGMNEKTIIRTDYSDNKRFTKHNITTDERKSGDRCVNVINSISQGMNEKTIIKEIRDHYTSVHPTQKPVKLLERLLNLVKKENDLVFDPFAGSFNTGIAAFNLKIDYIGIEIDEEYYESGKKNYLRNTSQQKLL